MWEDVIHLGSGHSLIIGHLPEKFKLAQVINKVKEHNQQDIVHLGLFDASQPNYVNYYPDATAEDFVPKDDEFIYPTFRALSEVIVHREWNPVDFSMHNALKNSMPLLVGATVNPDHESRMVGNAMGVVKSVEWENAYKSGGTTVPSGINGVYKIDAKSNPRIARAIMMDPPAVHSNSVTVRFLWDKSHPNLSEDEFWGKLGTYDKEGQMIRRIATRIKNYPETSLVHHGADPFAQKTGKDGKIVNPKYADSVYNSEQWPEVKNSRQNEKYFIFDFKTDLIQNSEQTTIPTQSSNNENPSFNMNLLQQLALKLGLPNDATEQQVLEKLQEVMTAGSTAQTSLNQFIAAGVTTPAEVTRLKNIETAHNALLVERAGLTPEILKNLVSFETTTLTTRRADVTALYNKVMDNKPESGIVAMIEGANLAALTALEKQYQTQLDAKFPLKCNDCQSTKVSRASSASNGEGDDKGGNKTTKTPEEVRNALLDKRKKGMLGMKREQAQ